MFKKEEESNGVVCMIADICLLTFHWYRGLNLSEIVSC